MTTFSRTGIFFSIVALVIFVMVIAYNTRDYTEHAVVLPTTPTSTPTSILPSGIAPLGWVVATEKPFILFIKSNQVPSPIYTELYAYDTFMLIERVALNGDSSEEWVVHNRATDDPLIVSSQKTSFVDRDMLEVVQHAGGADGKQLMYHYFTDSEVIIFSLYPYEFDGMINAQGVADLRMVADTYLVQQ